MPILNNLQVDESRFQPSLESLGLRRLPASSYTITSGDGTNPPAIDEIELYYCVTRCDMDFGVAFLGLPKVYNNGVFVGQVGIEWIESEQGSGQDYVLYLPTDLNAIVTVDGPSLDPSQSQLILISAVWNSEILSETI